MRIFRIKFFASLFFILIFFGVGYYYREDASHIYQKLFNRAQPCAKPITYSIASLDSRFGLSQEELLKDLKQAEAIWEEPINKNLFEYSPEGELKISLVYDYRQEATDALKKMGIIINNDRSTYDLLKTKHDSLVSSYEKEKSQLDSLIEAYNAEQKSFEAEVAYWNGRGGAPKAEYNMLEQKRAALNSQVALINQKKDSLNALVDSIKSTEEVLNKLVATLNLQVSKYNAIGSSAGKEFSEGEYIKDKSGTRINIFEFSNKAQLMKVLDHELGHALGLGHIDNPKAIMYYLNEGMNEALTSDDLAALREVCGVE